MSCEGVRCRHAPHCRWMLVAFGLFLALGSGSPFCGAVSTAPRSELPRPAVQSPTYLSDGDAQRFSDAGYTTRSAVYGTASEKMAQEDPELT